MAFHSNGFAAPSTATLSPTNTVDTFPSHVLSSSITSFSPAASARHSSQNQISKTYKQASHLFLTRRLPEALSTVLPLITPETEAGADEGSSAVKEDENGFLEPAPVARASRRTRVKVWSLYLTLLNAIVELEPEEGKDAFGSQWRGICAKVRDGEVWEEVVRNGYHGVEGDVDSEVVISLATLLLAHARTQTLNQKRLENYLAQCNSPNLDLSRRLSGSVTPRARSSRRYMSPAKGTTSGADTPRDLNARVKILELYTLHVLIRNNEWDYAREFISVSSVLDEERREAFLMALQSLQEDQQEADRREKEEREQQQEQLRREIDEAKKLRAENEAREQQRLQEDRDRRQGSEVDYGIDGTPSVPASRSGKLGRTSSPRPSLSRSNRKGDVVPTLGDRATMVIRRLQSIIDQLSASFQSSPMSLMKLAAFIIALILMFAKRDIRERIQRIMAASWAKIRATAGMGVKVSYI